MRNPGSEFKDSLDNKGFILGDTIICPSDGSGGAEWKITSIDEKGNIHAELIYKNNASKFYSGKETIVIIPEAYDGWEVVQHE